MVNEKSAKKSTATSSSKNGKTTTSSSSSSSTSKVSSSSSTKSSSSTVVEKSGSQTSVHSGVQIAEVTDLQRTDSGASLLTGVTGTTATVEYVVTTPEMAAAAASRGKEHYIFGGTKITEVGSSSSDFIRHEADHVATDDASTSSAAQRRFKTGGATGTHALATVPEVSHFSETTSSSTSSVQQSSTSSVTQTTTGADGKVDVQSREWGTSKQRSSADEFHAKSGTGIEPEVRYAEKHSQAKVKFDTGKEGDVPLYERSANELERSIEQHGAAANPLEYHKESSDKLKYDHKTGKYLTSVSAREHSRVLDHGENIIDSLSLQHEPLKDGSDALNVVHEISDLSGGARQALRSTQRSAVDDATSQFVSKSSSSTSSSSTIQKTASTTSDMVSSITSQTQKTPTPSKPSDAISNVANIKDTTTTYTSKKWDNKTQQWKVIGESTVTERDTVRADKTSPPRKSMPAAGVPSKRAPSQPAAGVPSRPQAHTSSSRNERSSASKTATTSSSSTSITSSKTSTLDEKSAHESGFHADNLAPKVMLAAEPGANQQDVPAAVRSPSPAKSFSPSRKPATAAQPSPKSAVQPAQADSSAANRDLGETIIIESSSSTSASNMQATSSMQIFDATSNTWHTVDESGVRHSDFASSVQPPQQVHVVQPAAGVPSTRRETVPTVSVSESLTEVFDEKTHSWKTVDQLKRQTIGTNVGPLPAAGAPSLRTNPTPKHETTPKHEAKPKDTNKTTTKSSTDGLVLLDDFPTTSGDTIVIESSSSTSANSMQASSSTQIFDSTTNTWKTVDESGVRHSDFQASVQPPHVRPAAGAPSRRATAVAGPTPTSVHESVTEVFDEKSQQWKTVDQVKQHAVRTSPAHLPAAGTPSRRKDTSQNIDKPTEVFDDKTQTWKSHAADKPRPSDLPTAGAPSASRRTATLATGIDQTITKTTVTEAFDDKTQTWKVVDTVTEKSNSTQPLPSERPAAGAPSRRPVNARDVNITQTTVTEVFDEKTQMWRVVDAPSTSTKPVDRPLPSDRPAAGSPSRRKTNTPERATKTDANTVSEVFDEKTQTWKVVDSSTMHIETTDKGPTASPDFPSSSLLTKPTKSSLPTVDQFISDERISSSSSTNINNSTTTTISKEFDEKTKTWKVVDQSTVYERDNTTQPPKMPTPAAGAPSRRPTKDDRPKPTEVPKKPGTTSDQRSSTTHVYDERTKTWLTADEKTLKTKRPSIMRYINEASDGTVTTIYKKKMFDRRSGKWRVVEEKVYNNRHAEDHIPEMIDDVTNLTRTTYSTKVLDAKTGTWQVVEEKSFSDTKTVVPRDIVEEIERDHADVANITTTTEITKVHITYIQCILNTMLHVETNHS